MNKHSFMFDCGDGTLRQLLNSPIARPNRIEAIFLTHLHCDHFYGLPAVAVALNDAKDDEGCYSESTRVLPKKKTVYSPKGLKTYMLPLIERNVHIIEFNSDRQHKGIHYDSQLPLTDHTIYKDDDVQVAAIFIKHSVKSTGYIVQEQPTIKMDLQRLQEHYKIPPCPLYKKLQNMEPIQSPVDGSIILPDEVVRKIPGRTIVILGDTFDPSSVVPYAENCDVLIHEATGVECDKSQVLKTHHSTGNMAGAFAKKIQAKHLILNHFSPRQLMAGIPCDEATYQRQILREAKEAAGPDILVTAAYDHLAIPVPKRTIVLNK